MNDEVKFEESRAFNEEHFAAALHAARLSLPLPADRVVVIGEGPWAQATVAAMLVRGVGKVIRVPHLRTLEIDQIRIMTGGLGPDLVYECSGNSEGRRFAIELVRPAGTVVLVVDDGKPTAISPNLLVFGDKRVLGSRSFEERDLKIARELIQSGRLGPEPGSITDPSVSAANS